MQGAWFTMYVLSVFLDEPDIMLKEVKVEQVVLNRSGKRAIRLDAWAQAEDLRQFNMEMQNDSKNDDIPKRSRFYQSMIDTPILKAGKETKYRNLPSTVIIFITQEDIFKRDRAKYTFTEQCEEVEDLKLEDGTTKIFLNMTSKNGSKELISMLQYMKETRIDNPEILVKDDRILELDKIVTEVRESEEWEAVQMNFMEVCTERGIQQGIKQGMQRGEITKLISLIRKKYSRGCSSTEIADAVEESEAYVTGILELIQAHPDWTDLQLVNHLQQNHS
jgi:predicted transposase/invertase (TIGR01784 family)